MNQVLIIDAGNTVVKLATFVNGELVETERLLFKEFIDNFSSSSIKQVVISSVLSNKMTEKLADFFSKPLIITNKTDLPINLQYDSPDTLGVDRICNAVYAAKNISKGHAVTIDIGTCLKFDVVSANGEYLGGSISPGINLRYKSLNDYTGNLPLLSEKDTTHLIGTDTNSSIHSGVINGINAEIYRLMEQYSSQFDDLTFFMTGGDARYFDIHSKNDIFAVENLTLFGLYEIYKFNA